MGGEESWSLGGNQGKFALGLHDGIWCECQGSARTTHIFKNGVIGFKFQASTSTFAWRPPSAAVSQLPMLNIASSKMNRLNRHSLRPCPPLQRQRRPAAPRRLLPSFGNNAKPEVHLRWRSDHTRCAGPAMQHQSRSLQSFGFHANPVLQLPYWGPDAHAKNYSLLLGPDNDRIIAPMYDVASGLAYENLRRKGRLAMEVGGENRFGRVGSGLSTATWAATTPRSPRCSKKPSLRKTLARRLWPILPRRFP